jgi:hypothetical protein
MVRPTSRLVPRENPMLASLAPLWILVAFALVGVIAGIAQMQADRWCPYCKLQVNWGVSKCPHCLCRLD